MTKMPLSVVVFFLLFPTAFSTVVPPSMTDQIFIFDIQVNPKLCVIDSHYVTNLFTFRDLSPPPNSKFNQSYPLTSPKQVLSLIREPCP
ncbi:unnamed protein product [Arabidopsis lyrata]|uniref:CAND6/7 N-terminal domain-containing protein n=1 Tax=Arabidopsis lyrata subsp. lyrata TaxID=81972 RepID=D7MJM1_ARALL|nr:hypothetical protein ARALYDRAFT_916361 [Arabidopsis lyrata subsp. lyrata]CAH8277525.1 unnamed protein product [Arabidopsis lyrata]